MEKCLFGRSEGGLGGTSDHSRTSFSTCHLPSLGYQILRLLHIIISHSRLLTLSRPQVSTEHPENYIIHCSCSQSRQRNEGGSTPPAQLRIFLSPSSQTAPLLCHEDCYGNSEVCLAPRNKESLRPCRPLAMEMPARALVLLIVHLVRGQDHLQSLATWVPLVWLVQRKCPIASPSQGRVPPHTRYLTDRTMQGGKCSPRLC